MLKNYIVSWDNKVRNAETHHAKRFEAHNAREARQLFDEWHAHRGENNPYAHIPHPFHIKVKLEK